MSLGLFEEVITPVKGALSEAGLVKTNPLILFRRENVSEETGFATFFYIWMTDNPELFLRVEGRLPHESDAGYCELTFGTSTNIEERWDPIRSMGIHGNLSGQYEVNSASFRTDVPEELDLIKILIDTCLEIIPHFETLNDLNASVSTSGN